MDFFKTAEIKATFRILNSPLEHHKSHYAIFHNFILIQLHRECFYFREMSTTTKGFTSLRGKMPSKY